MQQNLFNYCCKLNNTEKKPVCTKKNSSVWSCENLHVSTYLKGFQFLSSNSFAMVIMDFAVETKAIMNVFVFE